MKKAESDGNNHVQVNELNAKNTSLSSRKRDFIENFAEEGWYQV